MIGNQGHNGYVLRGLEKTPQVRLVGLSAGANDGDMGMLENWSDEHGHDPQVFDDHRRMLDALEPDVLSVAGPFELHAEMCIEAFQRGIHVFCEKPVATTQDDLARLKAAHSQAGVHFAAMMGLRYDPAFHAAWRAVQDGAIGTVRIINARKSYKLGQRPAYYKRRETYGGTIPWVGSHAIDWIKWFSGESFRTVFAAHSTRHNHDLGEMEMSALSHFTLTNEVFASVNADFLRPPNAPTHGDDRARVAGTEGVIEVTRREAILINDSREGEQKLEASCDRQIFRDFVEHVEGKTTSLLGPEDTFAVTEACLLARKSADEGRVMSFGSSPQCAGGSG